MWSVDNYWVGLCPRTCLLIDALHFEGLEEGGGNSMGYHFDESTVGNANDRDIVVPLILYQLHLFTSSNKNFGPHEGICQYLTENLTRR
jgi:hypothetical protein